MTGYIINEKTNFNIAQSLKVNLTVRICTVFIQTIKVQNIAVFINVWFRNSQLDKTMIHLASLFVE